jgi:hypothetical protein
MAKSPQTGISTMAPRQAIFHRLPVSLISLNNERRQGIGALGIFAPTVPCSFGQFSRRSRG